MSAPLVAHKPAKPSKPITVLAAGFLGLFVGFGVVATDLLTGGPFVNRRQAEEYLYTNVVAEVVAPTKGDAKQIDYETMRELSKVFYSPEHRQSRLIHISAVSDCPDGLRTSVCLASVSANHGCPTLLITVLPDDDSKGLVSHTPVKSSSENLYTLTLTPDFLAMPSNAWELVQPHCRNFQRIIIESTAMTQSSAVPGVLASVAESNLLIV